jgi:quercetin dioxygenase-like cupin family protein
MTAWRLIVPVGVASSIFALAAAAQAPQTLAPGEADPGVRPTRLIDRAEVRVSRVELRAGAVRRVHTHDDVEYHLWIPVSGALEITMGTEPPAAAASGQAFFMKRGTSHGFRNTGSTPAAVLEVFIKRATTAAAADLSHPVKAGFVHAERGPFFSVDRPLE